MNVYAEHPFKVILDYGHNAHAVGVMTDLIQRMDVANRKVVVLAAPGDRRDEDILDIADVVTGKYDVYVLKRDDGLRGRDGDEVPRMLAERLKANGVPESAIHVIPDEQQAIDTALKMAVAGDLLLIFGDALARCWKQITKFNPDGEVANQVVVKKQVADSNAAMAAWLNQNEAGYIPIEGITRDERGIVIQPEQDD
jgi:cyanophycin synthetase